LNPFYPSLGDINRNHIGIDINNVRSFASVDAASMGIDLKSGKRNGNQERRMANSIRDYSSVKLAAPSIDGRAPFAQGHENKEKKD